MKERMNSSPKVIVIGLDGATLDLVEPWVEEGRLPTFKKLIEEGVKARLESTVPPLTPCAWTSFKTGVNPGKHGVYDFYWKSDDHEVKVSTFRARNVTSLWRILSDHGLKCCVFNVPFTYPPEKVNGILISGFLSPSLESNFTYPPEFKKVLLKEVRDYQISETAKFSEKEEDQDAFLKDIFDLIDIRKRTVDLLRKQNNWDFFMVVFGATDHIQHWYWKYMDPSHPEYEPGSKFSEKIFEVYQEMDKILAAVMDSMDKDTVLVVMSDHGAGLYRKRIYLNNWLRREGYLHLKRTPKTLFKRFLYALHINPKRMIDLAFKFGLAKLNVRVSFKKKKAIFSGVGYSFHDIDWKRTRAFSFGYYGPIFINSKTNNRDGIVEEKDYEALREEIISKLRELEDPERGVKIVDKIWRREEIYSGPLSDSFPDICYSADDFSYTSSSFFALPSDEIFSNPLTRKSGEHRLDGLLLMYGDGIKRGEEFEGARIIDLAPTILKIFGIEASDNMDGVVLGKIFS
jgi:predicted AlkP superfamily phosphohydrolase/phosphomutase